MEFSEMRQRVNDYIESITITDSIVQNIGRVYRIENEGVSYPSVTTVLSKTSYKAGLIEWRESVGETEADKIIQRASERGNSLHEMIENFLQYKAIPKWDSSNLFQSIQKHLVNLRPIAVELPLYSHRLKTAGRVDCVAIDKKINELILFDWKSSTNHKQIYQVEDYFHQATAYSLMFMERTGIPIKKFRIIIACENSLSQRFERNVSDYYEDVYKRFKDYDRKVSVHV